VAAKNIASELTDRLTKLLPQGGEQLVADLRKNVRAAVSDALGRMDLVSREEFDVQRELLARTRLKLDALERRISDLESRQPQ
jgi:BMFP domain-containing protein YqiC